MTPATIETDRLTLSPLRADDADEMVAVLADESMYEFTGGSPPTHEQLRARYERMAVGASDGGTELWFNWIVRLRPAGPAVGVVQATVAADGSDADVAWEIGVPWQRRGFASEAAVAMVEWLVGNGVAAIRACVHPDHQASSSVAARVGLVPTDDVVDGETVWRRPGAA